jgi:hypothetical protein
MRACFFFFSVFICHRPFQPLDGGHAGFPDDRSKTTHPVTKHSMDELYYMTTKREMALKDLGYQYKCIWEHEFNRQLKNDAAMREYISYLDISI